jgi:hypothetical protein
MVSAVRIPPSQLLPAPAPVCLRVTTCNADGIVPKPPVLARKRGKCMTRRTGQNPTVRVGKRAGGTEYFFFQYWHDVAGQEERERRTEVVGLVSKMTKSEAERKKTDFLMSLGMNSDEYRIPSSRTFADAERHYREVFAPRMLRASTFSTAKYHIENHLLPDWKDTPIEHITIDSVNDWMWKKGTKVSRGSRSRTFCGQCSVFFLVTPRTGSHLSVNRV